MRIYIDTNIYLDYFLDRKKANHAYKIFKRALSCKFHIILSDQILDEVSRNIDLSQTTFLFTMLKQKIIKVSLDEVDKELAKTLPTHYADALHIILAKKAEAECIVTRNVSDFQSIFKTYRPEEL